MSKTMSSKHVAQSLEQLKSMIVELEEENSLSQVKLLLDQGVSPKDLLSCCMEGMHLVGLRFEEGTYFISALIMAGEIMRAATETISPHLPVQESRGGGSKVMLGTIQGDIHDLGKNLFSLLLKCHGIDIIDIGVDVPGQVILEKALEHKPDLIGISCVLTTSVGNLKGAVELLREKLPHPQPPVVIGGTCIDQRVADHVGAEHWAASAATGLTICKTLLNTA